MTHQPNQEAGRRVSGAPESYVFTLGLWYTRFIMMSWLIVPIAVFAPKVGSEPGRRGGKLKKARAS